MSGPISRNQGTLPASFNTQAQVDFTDDVHAEQNQALAGHDRDHDHVHDLAVAGTENLVASKVNPLLPGLQQSLAEYNRLLLDPDLNAGFPYYKSEVDEIHGACVGLFHQLNEALNCAVPQSGVIREHCRSVEELGSRLNDLLRDRSGVLHDDLKRPDETGQVPRFGGEEAQRSLLEAMADGEEVLRWMMVELNSLQKTLSTR